MRINQLVRPVGISNPQRAFGHFLSPQLVLHCDAGAEGKRDGFDLQRGETPADTTTAMDDFANKCDSTDGKYYNSGYEQKDFDFDSPTEICT